LSQGSPSKLLLIRQQVLRLDNNNGITSAGIMARKRKPNPSQAINLIYIRAAIEANTGVKLTLEQVKDYLVQEKLITPYQARHHAQIFRGYAEYYDFEDYTVERLRPSEAEKFL